MNNYCMCLDLILNNDSIRLPICLILLQRTCKRFKNKKHEHYYNISWRLRAKYFDGNASVYHVEVILYKYNIQNTESLSIFFCLRSSYFAKKFVLFPVNFNTKPQQFKCLLLKETNTPTRPRIEPGSPDPESDALTIRPVRPPILGKIKQQPTTT